MYLGGAGRRVSCRILPFLLWNEESPVDVANMSRNAIMKHSSTFPDPASSVNSILRTYSYRASSAQAILRLFLAFLVALEALFAARNPAYIWIVSIAVAYSLWVITAGFLVRQGKLLYMRPWLLLVDLGALTLILISAGGFAQSDPTASLLDDAFFLIPVLAVLQVKPWLTAAMSIATAAAYGLGTTLADPNFWDGARVFTHTLFLLSLGLVCVLLSWLQRSRTETIANLARDRARLLSEALTIEDRERQWLADTLHDGALQSVLAAWQDFGEFKSSCHHRVARRAHGRIETSLLDAIQQLRSTTSALHPTVLENLGLANALRAVGETTALRANFDIHFRFECEPSSLKTMHQKILFGAAREFLVNAAKHSRATIVVLTLSCNEHGVKLTVVDNGIGVPKEEFRQGLAEGHLGLASQRVRLESVDGRVIVAPRSADQGGTIASAILPHSLSRLLSGPPDRAEGEESDIRIPKP